MSLRSRMRLTVGVIAIAVATAVMVVPTARADDAGPMPDPSPATNYKSAEDMAAEERAQVNSRAYAVSHQIQQLAQFRDYGGRRGFTGVTYDVPSEKVDLWWKGRLDDDVAAAVAAARKRHVSVVVHPALRTLGATLEAMRRLEGAPMNEAGIYVEGVRPEIDCSGLHVEIYVPLTDQFLETDESRSARVKELGKKISGIPILSVRQRYQDVQSLVPKRSGGGR